MKVPDSGHVRLQYQLFFSYGLRWVIRMGEALIFFLCFIAVIFGCHSGYFFENSTEIKGIVESQHI